MVRLTFLFLCNNDFLFLRFLYIVKHVPPALTYKDMTEDLEPHGSRELVSDDLAADNHVNRILHFVY